MSDSYPQDWITSTIWLLCGKSPFLVNTYLYKLIP